MYSPASSLVDDTISGHHERRRSVPVSARCNRSPSLTMPITRLPLSTTGTALIPYSASSFAASGTVAFSSTVITSLVITSIARIGTSLDRFHHHLKAPVAPTCIEPDQPGRGCLRLKQHGSWLPPATDQELSFSSSICRPSCSARRSSRTLRAAGNILFSLSF